MNELASNFDGEAEVNCCCQFDVEEAIKDVIGTYEMRETCSGREETYSVSIEKSGRSQETILIQNFNNSNYSVEAIWDNGEFDLQNARNEDCILNITGSVHKASGKIFFIYAAFPNSNCSQSNSKTCEARSL